MDFRKKAGRKSSRKSNLDLTTEESMYEIYDSDSGSDDSTGEESSSDDEGFRDSTTIDAKAPGSSKFAFSLNSTGIQNKTLLSNDSGTSCSSTLISNKWKIKPSPGLSFLPSGFLKYGPMTLYEETLQHAAKSSATNSCGTDATDNPEPEPSRPIIDRNIFFDENDSIPSNTTTVKQGCYIECHMGNIESPDEFYVIPKSHFLYLELQMKKIQTTYNDLERRGKENPAIPRKRCLKLGMFVIAKFHQDGKWHRAHILEILPKGHYKVFLIDYGEILLISVKDIRYLLREFGKSINAQAIRCTASLGSHYRTVTRYGVKEREILRNIVLDKPLAVNFREAHQLRGSTAWKVWIHVLKDAIGGAQEDTTNFKQCREIVLHHVEREVLRVSRGAYFTRGSEDSEHKTFVFTSDLGENEVQDEISELELSFQI